MLIVKPKVELGIEVLKSWGFTYVTIAFIWHKQRTNPGYYTMSECEICVVGKKGKIPNPRGSRNERQFLSELRTKHSKENTGLTILFIGVCIYVALIFYYFIIKPF